MRHTLLASLLMILILTTSSKSDSISWIESKLTSDDLVIAYKDDVIVGSRYWNGEYTDVYK